MISNPQIKKLQGKDAENLKTQIKNLNFDDINVDELENKLK